MLVWENNKVTQFALTAFLSERKVFFTQVELVSFVTAICTQRGCHLSLAQRLRFPARKKIVIVPTLS